MSIKDRFKMVMDREKLTAGAFAESIGVAQATISHILGKVNMSNNPDSPENDGFDYPLFAENPENLSNGPEESKNRKEIALETALKSPKEIVKQEIIYKERPPRKITEIRIFFDDNTYETFRPEK